MTFVKKISGELLKSSILSLIFKVSCSIVYILHSKGNYLFVISNRNLQLFVPNNKFNGFIFPPPLFWVKTEFVEASKNSIIKSTYFWIPGIIFRQNISRNQLNQVDFDQLVRTSIPDVIIQHQDEDDKSVAEKNKIVIKTYNFLAYIHWVWTLEILHHVQLRIFSMLFSINYHC